MNEKQLAERGVSFYADGTNVPIANTMDGNEQGVFKGLINTGKDIASRLKEMYKVFKKSLVGKTLAVLSKTTTALYGVYKTDPVTFSERSVAEAPTADQQSMALGAMAQIPYLGQVIGVLDASSRCCTRLLQSSQLHRWSGFQDLLDGVIEALPAILEQIPVIITKIAELFSNKDTINKMIQSAILIVMAIVKALPTIQSLVTCHTEYHHYSHRCNYRESPHVLETRHSDCIISRAEPFCK